MPILFVNGKRTGVRVRGRARISPNPARRKRRHGGARRPRTIKFKNAQPAALRKYQKERRARRVARLGVRKSSKKRGPRARGSTVMARKRKSKRGAAALKKYRRAKKGGSTKRRRGRRRAARSYARAARLGHRRRRKRAAAPVKRRRRKRAAASPRRRSRKGRMSGTARSRAAKKGWRRRKANRRAARRGTPPIGSSRRRLASAVTKPYSGGGGGGSMMLNPGRKRRRKRRSGGRRHYARRGRARVGRRAFRRYRRNPGNMVVDLIKGAIPMVLSLYGVRALIGIAAPRIPGLASLGVVSGPLLSVAAIFGANYATKKVGFLAKHKSGIMAGVAFNAIDSVFRAFAPASVKAAIGMGVGDYIQMGDYIAVGATPINDSMTMSDYIAVGSDGVEEELGLEEELGVEEELGGSDILKQIPRQSFLAPVPARSFTKMIPAAGTSYDNPGELYNGIFNAGFGR